MESIPYIYSLHLRKTEACMLTIMIFFNTLTSPFTMTNVPQRMDLPPEAQIVTACPEIIEEVIDSTIQEYYILLACDGLWDVMSSQDAGELLVRFLGGKLEAQEVVRGRGVALANACQDLVKEALKRYIMQPVPLMLMGA